MSFYRGLIIVEPHGSYIAKGTKKVIIKSINFKNIANKPLLLIQNKEALGIIYLDEPKKINLKEFDELYNKHKITEQERLKWWKGKKVLYMYKIIHKKIFKRPYKIDYKQGPQVMVKPENTWKI